MLRGQPKTWLRGGWNRWTHAQTFPPQLMQPVLPGGTGFLQGTVQVILLLGTQSSQLRLKKKAIIRPCRVMQLMSHCATVAYYMYPPLSMYNLHQGVLPDSVQESFPQGTVLQP